MRAMVHFLTLAEGAGHLEHFAKHFGRRSVRRLSETTYAAFLGRKEAPRGVYVFTDRDRMNSRQRAIAIRLWDVLAAQRDDVRLLNNPGRQLGRYDLLVELHDRGINEFRAWRLDELPESLPFPVFVRKENDHGGPRSGLLHSGTELWRALAACALEGIAPSDLLVCQYRETVEPDGIYRKYGAMRVGSAVFGQFLILERRWEKSQGERIRTPEAREENHRYYCDNPHAEALLPVFELAGVEYGRMDYSMCGGKLQVWEINDNPHLAAPVLAHYNAENGVSRYLEGLERMADDGPEGGSFSFDFPWTDWDREELD